MAINNYTFDIPDPTAKLLQGLQTGAAFASIDQQHQLKALEMQQKQADMARTQQMRADLAMLADKPTAEAITQFQLRYPDIAEKMDAGLKGVNANMQKRYIDDATQVMAAISSGQNDTALKILGEKADIFEQSGLANDAQSYRQMADIIKTNPKEAYASTALMLSKAMGADKYGEMFDKLMATRREQELQPFKTVELSAKAKKAAVDAKYAESQAIADLKAKGIQTDKMLSDMRVNELNSKLAVINAQIAKSKNEAELQRLSMDKDKFERERNDYINNKIADAESARMNIDNMLNQADAVLKTPNNVMRAAMGGIDAMLPTYQDDVLNFERQLETLGSQAFLAQIPNIKGMGALSNAEGEKLQAALQNFSLKQSPDQLVKNVKEAQRLILKARKNIADRFGLPDTIADTPNAQPSQQEINDLLNKYGGQ